MTEYGYSVEVVEADDEWLRGLALGDERTIRLFVHPQTTAAELGATFAHEIGHALHQICGEAALDEWRERRALPDSVPDYVEPPHDYDSVSEDFAEAFRQFVGYGQSLSPVGEPVTAEWLHLNSDLFVPGGCPS
jgi:hypothetical protein